MIKYLRMILLVRMTLRQKLYAAIGGVCIVLAAPILMEKYLEHTYREINSRDPNINNFVLYDAHVKRIENSQINFAYYTNEGIRLRSSSNLNNLGYFSDFDYHWTAPKEDNEFRIVVLGGEQTASSTVSRSWPDYLQDYLGPNVRVYNIGWPDAGPQHYIKYWNQVGKKIDPDIVIVNYVGTDFYRGILGARHLLRYHGLEIKGYATAKYSTIHGEVTFNLPYTEGAEIDTTTPVKIAKISDPYVVPSRPYGTVVPTQLLNDETALETLRQEVVFDMIEGALNYYNCLVCKWVSGKSIKSVHELRNFDVIQLSPGASEEELIEHGKTTFGWMARNIPNSIFLRNPSLPQFNTDEKTRDFGKTMTLSYKMSAADSSFQFVNMNDLLSFRDKAQLLPLTLAPFMGEKWSDKGMKVYGQMVGDLLINRGLFLRSQ